MQCPIFAGDEDFCLHENCRYYDADRQVCAYRNGTVKKCEPETVEIEEPASPPPSEKIPDTRTTEKADASVDLWDDVTPSREHDPGTRTVDPPSERTMSAKEVWDLLSGHNRIEDIPEYETLIESLIRVVNDTPGIHYLTPKGVDFWCAKIRGICRYLRRTEPVHEV